MKSSFSFIPPKVRVLIKPIAALLVLSVLFFFAGKFGFSKIKDIRAQVKKEETNKNVLTQKLNILTSVGADASENADIATLALPSQNPILIMISQIRSLAFASSVSVSSLKGGSEVKGKGGISKVDLTFDVEGARPQVMEFLKNISKLAPITKVGKIKMSESLGIVRASVVTNSFWAELPSKLPALTDPIKTLSTDEQEILLGVLDMKLPTFSDVLPPETTSRSDPFN
ncbi:type 4a pilus biogenesis protein PilO [Patescibacteria group bacterium]